MFSRVYPSCTSESTQNSPKYDAGLFDESTAHKSGLTLYPCSMRPNVPGNDPPPWAKAIFRLGNFSRTPPIKIEQIALDVSAGIPTSQGSQYFCISVSPIIFQGWINMEAFRDSATLKKSENSGSFKFLPFILVPI